MKQKLFNFRSLFFTNPIPNPSKIKSLCTATHRRKSPPHFFDDVVPGTSAVYKHALKFQRPETIKWKPYLQNTTTFIGSVAFELQRINTKTDNFGVYTKLRVQSSNQPYSSIWVLLKMWGNVAEIAYEHLKPDQLICVSGYLMSYTRNGDDDSENSELRYELIVKKIDFVAQRLGYEDQEKDKRIEDGNQSGGNQLNSIAKAGYQSGGNRLHLWQVFFANPNEWWDQRKSKKNPKQPDFRHKDTGEALWLNDHDPQWVTRQLELLDSKSSEGGFAGRRSRVASWVFDE